MKHSPNFKKKSKSKKSCKKSFNKDIIKTPTNKKHIDKNNTLSPKRFWSGVK